MRWELIHPIHTPHIIININIHDSQVANLLVITINTTMLENISCNDKHITHINELLLRILKSDSDKRVTENEWLHKRNEDELH